MAKDKAACVARQAVVSRHGVGLGNRRAQGRWGAQGERAGARRESVLRRVGRAWRARQGERGVRGRRTLGRRARAGELQLGAGAGGRQQELARAERSGQSWLGGRRTAWALSARAGQDCALGALRLVFNPVFRLGIFPESLNEHYSL